MLLASGSSQIVKHLAAAIKAAYSDRAVLISLQTLVVAAERQTNGALAQLGEHLLCKQRVIGSIPIGSTKLEPIDEPLALLQSDRLHQLGSVAQLVRAHA